MPFHPRGAHGPAACPGLPAQPWLKQRPGGQCFQQGQARDFSPQPCGAGMGPGCSPSLKADVAEGVAVARAGEGRCIAVVGMERGQSLLFPPSLSPAPPLPPGGGSAATVPAHEGMSPDGMLHLDEGQLPHCHLTGTQRLETALLVEGHEEIFAHEQGAPGERQAPQVLQVPPHEDGALALLPEGAVHGQHVDVHCCAPRFVQGQRRLPRGERGLV